MKELGQMHNIKLIFLGTAEDNKKHWWQFWNKDKINIMDPKIFIVYNC